jgi:hypothetical protein
MPRRRSAETVIPLRLRLSSLQPAATPHPDQWTGLADYLAYVNSKNGINICPEPFQEQQTNNDPSGFAHVHIDTRASCPTSDSHGMSWVHPVPIW